MQRERAVFLADRTVGAERLYAHARTLAAIADRNVGRRYTHVDQLSAAGRGRLDERRDVLELRVHTTCDVDASLG